MINIKKIRKKKFIIFSKYINLWVYLSFLLLFALLLSPAEHGLGLFWDWNWPLYRSHLLAYFSSLNSSWSDANLGRPLSYSGSYYLGYLLSLTRYLPFNPETILYSFLVILTSVSSFGGYLFARRRLSIAWSVVIGLAIVINPAYFYKLMAGHLGYLASFTIFIYFVNYLYFQFKNNFRSGLILALILSFVGLQIQFFIFATIVLLFYYVFNTDKIKGRYLWLAILVVFLVNLPWLSNFIIGSNQIADSSNQAGAVAFEGSTRTSLLRILTMTFSDATLLKYFYSKYIFAFFGLLNLTIFGLIINKFTKPKIEKNSLSIIFSWIACILLGTGFFNKFNIPFISTFYPMLRESGHFAPVILLFGVLSLVFLLPESRIVKNSIFIYLVIFIAINTLTIYQNLPTCNFNHLRARLDPFKTFLENDGTIYRFISYPFFGQYSFVESPIKEIRNQPVKNTGIDSFSDSSPYESISNYIMAQTINQSLQFQLVKNYNLDSLVDRNVKYLFDYSSFYQSNIEKYSEAANYNNDLSLVKSDPMFFQKLIEKNPGRIKEVSSNIYEISAKPRVYSNEAEISIHKNNPAEYIVSINGLKNEAQLNFLNTFNSGWKLKTKDGGYQLSESSHQKLETYGQSWQINQQEIESQLPRSTYKKNLDGSFDIDVIIYFTPEKNFLYCRAISIGTILISILLLILPGMISRVKRRIKKK